MRKHYQYILVILSLLIVFLLYKIIAFKYLDIQKDIRVKELEESNKQLIINNQEKTTYYSYSNTNAFKDKISKTSQNKKNPWEEVIFIVTKEQEENYKKINIQEQMYAEKEIKKPTYWMSNRQKWVYYIFNKDIRD